MAATLVRMAGPRLLNLIAKRAAVAKPVGFLSAAKEAAGFKTAGEAVARLGPDIGFGMLGALGPGGIEAGIVDSLWGLAGSYAGDVLGAGAGGGIARARGLTGKQAANLINIGRTAGGFGGNLLPWVGQNKPRNDAMLEQQELYRQQILAQAGIDSSGVQALTPEMRPSSQSLLDQEIDARAAQYGVVDPEDPLTRYLLAQMPSRQ
jgi:hypothetical protein